VSAREVIEQLESMPPSERAEVLKQTLTHHFPNRGKLVERLLRRLENPDIPEDIWQGIEDAEDGRIVEMQTALAEKPPWVQ
jgi:hypothetical protein